MASKKALTLTKEGVKLASLASLSELHQNQRVLTGEFWSTLVNKAIDEGDMAAARIVADRLIPPKLAADTGQSKTEKPQITISIRGLGESEPKWVGPPIEQSSEARSVTEPLVYTKE